MTTIELQAYLRRIGVAENIENSLESLKTLHLEHPKYITFENIDSFTGIVPLIDNGSIFKKLVENQRGGYCYEQNILFKDVLETLGLAPKMHLARVVWSSRDGSATARSHMLLTVEINSKKYLADVGFGSMTLNSPLAFELDTEQSTPGGIFRLTLIDNFYQLEVLKTEWLPIYKFSLEEVEHTDLQMANWYIATGPDSMFNKFLMITRVDEDTRYSIFNNVFNIRKNDGSKESGEITTVIQLNNLLKDHFNLEISESLTASIFEKFDALQNQLKIIQ